MILLHKIIVDIQGFNENHFGIFDITDRAELYSVWVSHAHKDINKFISTLSPRQQLQLTKWATQRISYSTSDLILALEKFVKYLKKNKTELYPPPPIQPQLKIEKPQIKRHTTLFRKNR